MDGWVEWFLNFEERHKRVISFLTYILRESGGLVWPVLYGIILWRSWEFWDGFSHTMFIFVGSILTLIAIIYPQTWKVWAENRKKEKEEWIASKKIHIQNIDKFYYEFISYFPQINFWQMSREKGIEEKLLKLKEGIRQSLKQLKE
jgi:hypothetical protein